MNFLEIINCLNIIADDVVYYYYLNDIKHTIMLGYDTFTSNDSFYEVFKQVKISKSDIPKIEFDQSKLSILYDKGFGFGFTFDRRLTGVGNRRRNTIKIELYYKSKYITSCIEAISDIKKCIDDVYSYNEQYYLMKKKEVRNEYGIIPNKIFL